MAPTDLLILADKRIGDSAARLNLGGLLLRYNLIGLRFAQRLALLAAGSALATAGLAIGMSKPALAEFEIQEVEVQKGEKELEYRGAVHWGFPKAEKEAASDGEGDGEGALEEEDEGPLRQSHDFELQYGISDRWLFSTTLTADQPLGENFNVSSVELGLQYEIIEREGNGIGLAFQSEYGFATRGGEADEIGFGPIVELATGKLLLTLNPIFGAQIGDNRQTDGLGFEYGWRAEYDFSNHWGIGVEMFGEIEDLSNSGSFNDQNHSIGPTLFWNPNNDEDEAGQAQAGDNEEKVAGPAEMELSFNVGVQFGLTDVTSDGALKFQAALAW
jgi:hypothetical protein